jgi:xanthine/CO dehydrogenase XdhC/CoxF family maturation factor
VHEWGELPRALRGTVLADARTSLRDRRSRLTTRRAGEVQATVFHDCVTPPPRILILGAGEDAAPVARLARELGWPVTVADHRAGRAVEFAEAPVVTVSTPAEIAAVIGAGDYAAAIVMSHKLAQDRLYLSALARSAIPYVGLLGPAARRRSLLDGLGAAARDFETRCFGPAGLDIGAETPEEIALSIVAGIQSFLRGCPGGAFARGSGRAPAIPVGRVSTRQAAVSSQG